ncbi:hypothetical protein [Leeuwenhoekiella parthenopeia]|uniref:TonB C-terminal domain-containing protein n=1 Tax=Leeuwenhoekiella parthenopeia TaxID=2890320 RepID=A0ABS8GNK7_9FLAO|nr:hypothetical protein [Leeuwenhoekiella parthenopeia]MCC4211494.1 hypothetical protein [Leeuwenhoekiella parthenopeia]
MKIPFCTNLVSFLVLIYSQSFNAQETPIETISDGAYTIFNTSNHNQMFNQFSDQPYSLMRMISDSNTDTKYKSGSGFNLSSFQQTFTSSTFNFLRNNRSRQSRFSITYIIDQIGNTVLSCSLRFPTNLVSLSSSEVEAILTAAMNHSFHYINKPIGDASFLFKKKFYYIL